MRRPKILALDIETSPIISYTWGIHEQDVAINQIKKDWCIIAFAAKFLDEDKMHYLDQRKNSEIIDDKKILSELWSLIESADILLTQNGKHFDIKKINSKFITNGFKPLIHYRQVDTLQIARAKFGFTSNKLEFLCEALQTKHRKLKHGKFPGFDLWKECMAGNREAWNEMERYNKNDVLALIDVYNKVSPWDNAINFNVYHDDESIVCNCGSEEFEKRGFHYSNNGKYQRYRCKKCGTETRSKSNLFSKEKRESLKPKL